MSEVIRQLASAEYGALAVAAGPVTAAVLGWLLRQLVLHLRDAQERAYVGQLVAWAQQVIPEKSERYAQVATLLAQRFPGLPASDVQVLIESEVHALKQLSAVSGQPPAPSAAPAVQG
ncbi:MAG: hypothetical protein ACJ8H8_15905 [Geminicoccaceae bacterium]